MDSLIAYIPYCGTPPGPEVLWSRWNLDPVLMLVLIGLAMCCAPRRPGAQRRELVHFTAGWIALAIALLSPLCNLSIALFSARVGQHMWLALIAAPLIARSRPLQTLAARLGRTALTATVRFGLRPAVAATFFGIALWYWHMPRPYQASFESHLTYWLMHVTLTGSAVLLWESLLAREREQVIGRLFAAFATLLHMGMLGAIITLAPRLLYPTHLLTTPIWGLSPLDDQQLGGLIMWVPGCTALALILLMKLRELLPDQGAACIRPIENS